MKVDMRIRDFMTGMIVRSFSCHRKLRPMTQKRFLPEGAFVRNQYGLEKCRGFSA